ncbi:MAG: hypothetical protein KDD22_05840 [Bdellovibrionales bacterium]|nr:hypothetical protein [Bdellovibrionales bacterium]
MTSLQPEVGSIQRERSAESAILLLQRYAACIQQFGYQVKATSNHFHRILNVLSCKDIERIHELVIPSIRVAEDFLAQKTKSYERPNEVRFLKHFMTKTGTTSLRDVESIIDHTDIIEVYDKDAIQCYRSFNFFDICSYSLEDLFSHEWWNLYKRNTFVTRKIGNICQNIFANGIEEPIFVDVPHHVAREIWSPLRTTIEIKQKYLIPLTNSNAEVGYYIATFQILRRIHDVDEIESSTKELSPTA